MTDLLNDFYLFSRKCLYLQDDSVNASANLCITSSQYSQTIMLMTQSCHQFMAGHIMAAHQYDCVLNIAQCHQVLIYKQRRCIRIECDPCEECQDQKHIFIQHT